MRTGVPAPSPSEFFTIGTPPSLLTTYLRVSKTTSRGRTHLTTSPEEAAMPAQDTEHRSFTQPDEVREFPRGHAEIVKVGGGEVGRLVFEPGWRWSNDVKPVAGTDSCEAPHMQFHVSGRLGIRMDDGTEFIAEPGDVTSLPKG